MLLHRRARSLLCTILALATFPSISRAQSSADGPDTAAAIHFPTATPWGHLKPKTAYDGFTDSTQVWLSVDAFKVLGSIDVITGYSFAGRTPAAPPAALTLVISVKSDSYSASDSHDAIKQTVKAATSTPIIFLLADGSRVRLDGSLADNDVRLYGGSAVRTAVTYVATVPTATYVQIVSSAPPVKVRAGTTDFELSKREIEAMRNFAGHMATTAATP